VARSKVELFEEIRRDRRAGGSTRELAEKHHVHRRTMRQALASSVPPPRKAYPHRSRPTIAAYAAVIDGWLLADGTRRASSGTPRGGSGSGWSPSTARVLAEVTVSRYVAGRRAELGLDRVEVAVPQARRARPAARRGSANKA
jgi:hypothetical protein